MSLIQDLKKENNLLRHKIINLERRLTIERIVTEEFKNNYYKLLNEKRNIEAENKELKIEKISDSNEILNHIGKMMCRMLDL